MTSGQQHGTRGPMAGHIFWRGTDCLHFTAGMLINYIIVVVVIVVVVVVVVVDANPQHQT